MKNLLWKVAEAKQEKKFDKLMEELKLMLANDPRTIAWLDDMPRYKWAFAFDPYGRRYGSLTTNAAECFNSILKGGRDLPITALVQFTFNRVNKYFVRNRRWVASLDRSKSFVPRVTARVEGKIERARTHSVKSYDDSTGEFQVITRVHTYHTDGSRERGSGKNKHTVHMIDRTCTCGKFAGFHYPCSHALAVCKKMGWKYDEAVQQCFTIDAAERTWDPKFYPIPDVHYWEPFISVPHAPDSRYIRTGPGRPNTNRRKNEMDHGVREYGNFGSRTNDEAGTSQQGARMTPITPSGPPRTVRCSKCGQKGHNKRACPLPTQ